MKMVGLLHTVLVLLSPATHTYKDPETGLELTILKGTPFEATLNGPYRAPKPLHVKEKQNKRLLSRAPGLRQRALRQ